MYMGLVITTLMVLFVYFRAKHVNEIKAHVAEAYPEVFTRLSKDKMKVGVNNVFVLALEESLKCGELSKTQDKRLHLLTKRMRDFDTRFMAVSVIVMISYAFF
ncbi:hypothetical protein C1E23_07480 [Pseudoalteromonas phenolica]|uniref:Uncharacterized protein n=1 Tax=Pseudoalteromonas phenolica TaxID=161398 RepID=A0A4Q7IP54_9GAMM|nr:hypothetical protein [Pseudoalteromonas phenolica]RZQ53710.1 hypothetical protein C1E23_07480 [Pseudoalteromonas phenolica]